MMELVLEEMDGAGLVIEDQMAVASDCWVMELRFCCLIRCVVLLVVFSSHSQFSIFVHILLPFELFLVYPD